MAYDITADEVKCDFATGASNTEVEGFIAVVDQANACLTANSVSEAIGRTMKITAVRALLREAGGGEVIEERAVSGASRKYADKKTSQNSYMTTLRSIDKFGCVMATISKGASVQMRSVGRRYSA